MICRYKGVYLLWISSFFLFVQVSAQQAFDTGVLKEAYEDLLHLRYEDLDDKIQALSQNPTGQILALHLANYKDFLQVFSTDNEELYEALRSNKEKRLDALKLLDDDNPYHAFVKAEIVMQWAVMDARFKKYIAAYRGVSSSYALLEKNLKTYPEFLLSRKSLAICHALVGAIPDKYRWGFQLISRMEGTIDQGLEEIDEVIEWTTRENLPYREEAVVAKTYILLHLANEPQKAVESLGKSNLDPSEGPIACFIHSNLALKMKDSKKAIELLNNYLTKNGDFELPYLYFLRGLSRIQSLDTGAREDFEKFIERNRGNNYVKEAYQKMAWSYLIEGNEDEYHRLMNRLLQEGELEVGGDQNAQKEAEKRAAPNMDLLKARLLFDGGECTRAQRHLEGLQLSNFNKIEEQVELIYRKGRVAQCNNEEVSAIIYFIQCINLGEGLSAYFPCNAALQLGMIFEEKGDKASAREYYKKCLSSDPDDYAKALHAKATAGLKRLEDK